MYFKFDTVNVLLLCIIALNAIGFLAYIKVAKSKALRERRNANAIRDAIIDYFRKSGVGVAVGCTPLRGTPYFTAVVESEPMKRFRLSHIIEIALIDHVRQNCHLELEKVYWRFPIKEANRDTTIIVTTPETQGATEESGNAKAAEKASDDAYINEGLEYYRDIPKAHAEELHWEAYEQASLVEPKNEADVVESARKE